MNDAAAPLRTVPARHLVVVGLGLVGGSVALAARIHGPLRCTGIDRAAIGAVALEQGIVDDVVDDTDVDAINRILAEADLVVLALPVLAVATFLERHQGALARADLAVTDTGATKRHLDDVAGAAGLANFIGGHPMAGKAQGGLAHASAHLFEGARWFLCARRDADTAILTRVRAFVSLLGAVPVEVDAGEHDRDVALTSHLPHLVANAVAEVVLQEGALHAAGGSLRDLLVVAGAPFESWGDTIQTNQVAIGTALDDLISRLTAIRAALDDKDRLRDLFAHGRAVKERSNG